MSAQLYAEDFRPGDQYEGQWQTVDREVVDLFAQITGDKHPIHYDAEYAKGTRFGRPVVHGLLLAGLTALGAAEVSARMRDSMVAFVSVKADFLAPVFIDDRVRAMFTVSRVELPPGKRNGRVEFSVELHSASGGVCLRGEHAYILERRSSNLNAASSSDE